MESSTNQTAPLKIAARLRDEVLSPLKQAFVGKDEVIELLGVCLVARENLFIYGPPGTAKSAIVQQMARRIEGQVFDYLLTRFTEPNEIFGPFDIRELRDGNLVTNVEGMLPEATFVFLDELLNANSAILNSLLLVLNERMFRRGRENRKLPTLMVVGASNHLPEDEALGALFDRFLLRVNCVNVPSESLTDVLHAGWKMENKVTREPTISIQNILDVQQLVPQVSFENLTAKYVELIGRLRQAGIAISDRRAVKLQRTIAASAVMCGRLQADVSDMWVLRYIWDTVEQQEILDALIKQTIEAGEPNDIVQHELANLTSGPDPEQLAVDLLKILSIIEKTTDPLSSEIAIQKDRLVIIAGRLQWIENQQQRDSLQAQVDQVWNQLEQITGVPSDS